MAVTAFCSAPHLHKPLAYSFSIDGQTKESGTPKPQKKPVSSTVVGEIKANGTAEQKQDAAEKPESWGSKFWCEINASDWFIGLFTLFLAIATYFLWRETERLAGGADDQADKMAASIKEAARAATAMEGVAISMASNAAVVKTSVEIQRELTDRNKLVTELQSRAYLDVTFESVTSQNVTTGFRYEPRMSIVNQGLTPAYKVKFRAACDLLIFPLDPNFTFPLPLQYSESTSVIGPRLNRILSGVAPRLFLPLEEQQLRIGTNQRLYIWGDVLYEDAFKIQRTVRFAKSFVWLGDPSPTQPIMSYDAPRHTDSD